ncbi:MAG: M20/M25/M40 family metallo-hydrolase [Actinobacteria bacterium]|nr:M20/M25/M40 family metallo-hydrolase [Actinomycetota bacterium]
MSGGEDPTGEVTELLRQLIRNACVNDGSPGSGGETRNAGTLADYLDGSGLAVERYEPLPGRESLVGRIEGADPDAPALLLMGHIDVVPVSADRWRHDPFGGELIDGEVWGRGAVDMLNLTASMAVATRRLAVDGFRPRGTLVFLAVADEEALGAHGADWLLENEPDAVRADHVVTEAGGFRLPLPSTTPGPKLPVLVGEKGTHWCTIRVTGTSGHGSMPLRTDNALVKAAEVVRRIAEYRPTTRIPEVWRRFVEGLDLPAEIAEVLLDPAGVAAFVESFDDVGVAREVHAATHTTFAPTVLHGGVKTNVIPDSVELQVDIRTLPGQTGREVREMLDEAIGPDLAGSVEVVAANDEAATESPMKTPLWDSLQRATGALVQGARVVPMITTGATDARFFRRKGITAYGAGLFSDRISFAEFTSMFHGDDERIDQESLRLSTELWLGLARDLLG